MIQTAPPTPIRFQLSATAALLIVVFAVIFFASIRHRLRDMPLERDEGEYAYSGQLLLQGVPPYKLAYNMKLPGIYATYAGMMALFGETAAAIHLGLLLVNAASAFLLYLLTSMLYDRLAAVVAACSFALLSTSTSVMGFEAHATNFVVLPALVGILLLLRALRFGSSWLLFLSGLCNGIAFLMKQHGIFFVLFCFLYLAWIDRSKEAGARTILRDATTYASGAILPYCAACWGLWRVGVFPQFWFWTVSYAGEYSKVGTHRAVRAFLENARTVMTPALPVWVLAAVGMWILLRRGGPRRHAGFIARLFLFSFLSLVPGGYFRQHYFVLLLPATAILVGVAVSTATENLANHPWQAFIPALVFLASFGYAVFQQRRVYFSLDPEQALQATYGLNAFGSAREVARYINSVSPDTARIAVIGSEPEIYFYAHRHSATGYIYMYSLIVRQKYSTRMREEMMRELVENRPDYLVYVDDWDSWGKRDGGPQVTQFLDALQQYMADHYDRVGLADVGEPTRYVWGASAKTYAPKSSKVIYALRRKQSEPSQTAFASIRGAH
jgi:4-amino-4-deoxy-L-arabinose transferase-like glycosyltransferase